MVVVGRRQRGWISTYIHDKSSHSIEPFDGPFGGGGGTNGRHEKGGRSKQLSTLIEIDRFDTGSRSGGVIDLVQLSDAQTQRRGSIVRGSGAGRFLVLNRITYERWISRASGDVIEVFELVNPLEDVDYESTPPEGGTRASSRGGRSTCTPTPRVQWASRNGGNQSRSSPS